MQIRRYDVLDEAAIVALWRECGLVRPWNDPLKDIRRKLTVPELFLAATIGDKVDVLAFYRKLGYARDDAVSQGKRRIPDEAP